MTLLIAIDPGVNTGFAKRWTENEGLYDVRTLLLHEVLVQLRDVPKFINALVVFEDARKRTWFGKKGREALQGAGSIKRDCSIIQDCLEDWNIPYYAAAPKSNWTKLDAEAFKSITGWEGRTSNHARDAAMLIHGMSEATAQSLIKQWERRK